jgi:hypothetical protein
MDELFNLLGLPRTTVDLPALICVIILYVFWCG